MTIIAIGKNERIEYCNVARLTEYDDCFIMNPSVDKLIEVIVNSHMVAMSDQIMIEKRCFVCNELYIDDQFVYHDTDSDYKAKARLNRVYGKRVNEFFTEGVKDEELPFK